MSYIGLALGFSLAIIIFRIALDLMTIKKRFDIVPYQYLAYNRRLNRLEIRERYRLIPRSRNHERMAERL